MSDIRILLRNFFLIWRLPFPIIFHFNQYRQNRQKVGASIFDSALSHTRRSDAWEKNLRVLLDVFACGQVPSARLYRLIFLIVITKYK